MRAILARGDEVVVIDNFATISRERVDRLSEYSWFSFIEADVCAAPPVTGQIDAIAHLACPASPDEYMRLPLETLSIGSRGSEFVLRLALLNQYRVLLASTSEVYGDPLERPRSEECWGNATPTGPRSVYDVSKRYAEALFMANRRTRGVNTAIVRIFHTYSPGMRPKEGRVVSNFIAQALKGDPLTIYGDGRQTRRFCYVSDLVVGLLPRLDSDEAGPVNLGNPNEISILELAETILHLTAFRSPLAFSPAPQDARSPVGQTSARPGSSSAGRLKHRSLTASVGPSPGSAVSPPHA